MDKPEHERPRTPDEQHERDIRTLQRVYDELDHQREQIEEGLRKAERHSHLIEPEELAQRRRHCQEVTEQLQQLSRDMHDLRRMLWKGRGPSIEEQLRQLLDRDNGHRR